MLRTHRSLGAIGFSSVAAAILTWLSLLAAARALGPARYSDFLVVWGLFFGATGVLAGLQQEVTRAASVGLAATSRTRLLRGTAAIACMGMIGILVTSPAWAPGAFGDQWGWSALALAVCFAGYCAANLINGALAGTNSWNEYATLILIEGVLRAIAIMVVVVWFGGDALSWGLAITTALAAWVVVGTLSPKVRTAPLIVGDVGVGRFLAHSGQAIVAAACSATIVTGIAPLLKATDPGDYGAASGVVLAVIIASRAPVLVLLAAFQGPIIAGLVQAGPDASRHLVRWFALGLGATVLGAAIGWAVGPVVIQSAFGHDFKPDRLFVASAIFGAGSLALLTVTGWLALARRRHSIFLVGWVVALVATILALRIDVEVQEKVGAALVVGPLLGVLTIIGLLRFRLGLSSESGQ